jgi:hypothetical protein
MSLFDKWKKRGSSNDNVVQALFEAELRKRGITFSIDPDDGRHAIKLGDWNLLVSLDNLRRSYELNRDASEIGRFVDTCLAPPKTDEDETFVDRLFWCLEPNDYQENSELRVAVSDRVNRVLVHFSSSGTNITWVTPGMLNEHGLTESDAFDAAFANLAREVSNSPLFPKDIDGVELGMIGSGLPFKAALILAPNVKEVWGERLGWPLLAVVPDREFLYFWAERHTDFVGKVGHVVVGEFDQAPYPISTEIYRISDEGVKAIGEFQAPN